MMDLIFKVTGEGGESRDIVVRIHEPTRNPPEKKWPWAVTVDIDGRPSTTYGVDPLDAVENGAQHAAIVLRGVHGDALDPPVEPRMKEGE
ncbi:hypothetical protein [Sorangium sp. So ce388]|uniref:hypothetical protein n=1 Tax=Sorangium sp. So ce388 TaxID=3133309 RepID=UPI003F5CB696